jgi:cytoskeleton protein RodZ
MTNETQQPHPSDTKPTPFGARLKSARESLGLERAEVAAQLRLNEKIIIMMEKDRYPADLPVTFIRGYLRAYGKLLQIPEYEVKKAIEPIKPKLGHTGSTPSLLAPTPVTTSNYFMQVFTYLIVITLVGLLGMWWYSHSTGATPMMAENQLPIAPLAPSIPSPSNLSTQAEAALAEANPQHNPVDRTEKITNDTDRAATKLAQSKKMTRKRVIPEEITSENDSSEEELDQAEASSESQAD